MSSVIRNCEAISPRFIATDDLDLTIKFQPTNGAAVSYSDLVNVLSGNGIRGEEVQGIYKVSASDSTYSVLFKEKATVEHLTSLGKLSSPRYKFDLVHMFQQVIKIRIHWLPLYYEGVLLKGIFCDYGEILDIKRCKTVLTDSVFYNGVRELTMKVDETDKMKIPHLINFGCGQTILVTMQGRPPLCLKCRQVGHVRRDCGPTRQFSSLFKGGVDQRDVWRTGIDPRDTAVRPAPQPAGTSTSTAARTEPNPTSAAGSVAATTVTTTESQATPVPHAPPVPSTPHVPPVDPGVPVSTPDQGTSVSLNPDADVEMSGPSLSQKRSLEEFDLQDYFTPNKTARPQSVDEGDSQASQSNAFALFGDITDLNSDNDDDDSG